MRRSAAMVCLSGILAACGSSHKEEVHKPTTVVEKAKPIAVQVEAPPKQEVEAPEEEIVAPIAQPVVAAEAPKPDISEPVEGFWQTTRYIGLDDIAEGNVNFTDLVVAQDRSSTKLCGIIREPDKPSLEFVIIKDHFSESILTHRNGKYGQVWDVDRFAALQRLMATSVFPRSYTEEVLQRIDFKKYDEVVRSIIRSEGYKHSDNDYITLTLSFPNFLGSDEDQFKQAYFKPRSHFREALSCKKIDYPGYTSGFLVKEDKDGSRYTLSLSSDTKDSAIYLVRPVNGNTHIFFTARVKGEKEDKFLQTESVFNNKGELTRVIEYEGNKGVLRPLGLREIDNARAQYDLGVPYLDRLIRQHTAE